MTNSSRNILCSNRGVYLPLLALFISLIASAFMVFGHDSIVIRRKSLALQKATDDICYSAATSGIPMIQDTSAAAFINGVESLKNRIANASADPLYGVKLSRADLFIPTSGNTVAVAHIRGGAVTLTTRVLDKALSLTADENYAESKCHLDNSAYCKFFGDGDWLMNNSQEFPAGTWTSQVDAGNTVACVFEAEFDTMVSGVQNLKARSAEQLFVRTGKNADKSSRPGLSLIIAPQTATHVDDLRFRFNSDGNDKMKTYFKFIDPLENSVEMVSGVNSMTLPKSMPFQGFSEHTDTSVTPEVLTEYELGNDSLAALRPVSQYCRAGEAYDCDLNDPSSCSRAPDSNCTRAVQELAIACMNPAIYVRNTFISSMLELSSRDGELRDNVGVYMANAASTRLSAVAESEAGYNGDSAHDWSLGPSTRATALWMKGHDLTSNYAQLPFATFRSLGETDSPWVNPWQSNPLITKAETDDSYWKLADQQTLIANQLRYCGHLYANSSGGSGASVASAFYPTPTGIRYLNNPTTSEFSAAFQSYNLRFEDRDAFPFTLFPRTELEGREQSTVDGWAFSEQNPWNLPEKSLKGFIGLSLLGSVQSCPSPSLAGCQSVGYWDNALDANGVTLARADLEPDLVGALGASTSDDTKSYPFASPGMFQLTDNQATTTEPFGGSFNSDGCQSMGRITRPYRNCSDTNSHQLLVLHTPPSDSQATALRDIVSNIRDRGQLVTVVYIPVARLHAEDEALQRLYKAFGFSSRAKALQEQSGLFSDPILVLSPYTVALGGGADYPFGRNAGLPEWENFSNYWHWLINFDSNPRENIVEVAKKLFLHRVLKRKLQI